MSKDHARKDAVIVSAVRTPVGKFQGTLAPGDDLPKRRLRRG